MVRKKKKQNRSGGRGCPWIRHNEPVCGLFSSGFIETLSVLSTPDNEETWLKVSISVLFINTFTVSLLWNLRLGWFELASPKEPFRKHYWDGAFEGVPRFRHSTKGEGGSAQIVIIFCGGGTQNLHIGVLLKSNVHICRRGYVYSANPREVEGGGEPRFYQSFEGAPKFCQRK